MATPDSIKAKLLGLKNKCTEATGVVDSDLTSAVNRVIDEIDKKYAEGIGAGYTEGFADGKASVKLIKFYVDYSTWVALSGMTWREYVTLGVDERFFIRNEEIHYENNPLGYSADSQIVENGVYVRLVITELNYNSQRYELRSEEGESWESWVTGDFNTIGLYFDDNGFLRTPTGEYVYANTGDENYTVQVDKYCYIEWSEYEAKAVYSCNIVFETITFEPGMTWEDFVNSSYNIGNYIDGDFVRHYGGDSDKAFYYSGVQVKPTDELINGAEYQYQ